MTLNQLVISILFYFLIIVTPFTEIRHRLTPFSFIKLVVLGKKERKKKEREI